MEFSVLMSLFNKENPRFLIRALASILEQTLSPKEIVLIKDGPLTKELDEVVDECLKKYPELFKIFSFEKNQGLGKLLDSG